MPVIRIHDPADPRIDPYLRIRERDLVGRDGRFIVEGRVTLGVLIDRSRFEVESVFLAESRLEPLSTELASLPDSTPVYTATQSIMNEIAGFDIHRGVLAIGRKRDRREARDLLDALDRPARILVLAGLSNHDNVGAAFRNAAALGAGAVLLDRECCDPLYRKAIRVSGGAALWLPFAHSGAPATIIEDAKACGYDVWTLTPRSEAVTIRDVAAPKRLAIVLGAEGPGLPDDVIALGRPVRIPMANDVDSLNVATAGAVALSWAARSASD